jgi:hypothetical protein
MRVREVLHIAMCVCAGCQGGKGVWTCGCVDVWMCGWGRCRTVDIDLRADTQLPATAGRIKLVSSSRGDMVAMSALGMPYSCRMVRVVFGMW